MLNNEYDENVASRYSSSKGYETNSSTGMSKLTGALSYRSNQPAPTNVNSHTKDKKLILEFSIYRHSVLNLYSQADQTQE